MNTLKVAALAACLAVALAACSEESSSPFQPNVVNETDTLAVQAGAITNVSATEVYAWENPGVTADVGQSGILTSGSAALTVMDADGNTVYVSDLASTGTFTTDEGVAGTWQVRLVLSSCSGDIDFSLQTP